MTTFIGPPHCAIRNKPISEKLKRVLDSAAQAAGVDTIRITSGGQDGTRRTGSRRHDHGRAADLQCIVGGNTLTFTDQSAPPSILSFVTAAAAAGATGIGAGVSYMGPRTIHVGFGNSADDHSKLTWGSHGRSANAPRWLRDAANAGWEEPALVHHVAAPGIVAPGRHAVIARSGLKLRGGPGTNFGSERTLPAGTELNVLQASSVDPAWVRVNLEDDDFLDGYVLADFLGPVGAKGEDAPEPDGEFTTADECLHESAARIAQLSLAQASAEKPAGTAPAALTMTPEQRLICERVINVFETGSTQGDYSNISIFADGPHRIRQITYGRAQTTEYGNLRELVEMYVDAGGIYSDHLRPYVNRIGRVTLVNNEHFKDLLRRAGREDQVMRDTQDEFFDHRYFQSAKRWAESNSFARALSMLVIYDSYIHSGRILELLRARFPEPVPARGGDEKNWIKQYVDVRNRWLANHSNPVLRKTTYRTRDLAREIARSNWDLAMLPILAHGVPVDARVIEPRVSLAQVPPGVPYIPDAASLAGDDEFSVTSEQEATT